MSSAVRRTCEMAEALREKMAGIRQGTFEPLYLGCEQAPYRIRFVPRIQGILRGIRGAPDASRERAFPYCPGSVYGLQPL